MNNQTKAALAEVDWRSPNTHVFFLVQIIGVTWFIWLIVKWFVTGSPETSSMMVIFEMIIARYLIGMWFVTAWRHRYFAHHSFKIAKGQSWIEPLIAIICSADAQRGVAQWGAEHIEHHMYSDTEKDHHSCKQKGRQWCHWLWVVKKGSNRQVNWSLIPLLARSRAVRWIETRQWIGIVVGGGIFSTIGAIQAVGGYSSFLSNFAFSLCAHFFATTLLWHGTFLINSAMHIVGSQRYDTGDESRNSLLCAILTLGEGWHNNHHWDFPSLETAKRLRGVERAKRDPSTLYWQGKTRLEKCFDWSGISIWCLIKLGILKSI